MTPTTPLQEAQAYLQARELSAYTAYKDSIDVIVSAGADQLTAWHDAADQRTAWLGTNNDAVTAANATPCAHRISERAHHAQHCCCCWTISTYVRLSEPKESE